MIYIMNNNHVRRITAAFVALFTFTLPIVAGAQISAYGLYEKTDEMREILAPFSELSRSGSADLRNSVRSLDEKIHQLETLADEKSTILVTYSNNSALKQNTYQVRFLDSRGNPVTETYTQDYSERFFGVPRRLGAEELVDILDIPEQYGLNREYLLRNPNAFDALSSRGRFADDVVLEVQIDHRFRAPINIRFLSEAGEVRTETIDMTWDMNRLPYSEKRRESLELAINHILSLYPDENASRLRENALIKNHRQELSPAAAFLDPAYPFVVTADVSELDFNTDQSARTEVSAVLITGSVPDREITAEVLFPEVGLQRYDDYLPPLIENYTVDTERLGVDHSNPPAVIRAAVQEIVARIREDHPVTPHEVRSNSQISVDMFDSPVAAETYLDTLSSPAEALFNFGTFSIIDTVRLTVGKEEGYELYISSDQGETITIENVANTTYSNRYDYELRYGYPDAGLMHREVEDRNHLYEIRNFALLFFEDSRPYPELTLEEFVDDMMAYLFTNPQAIRTSREGNERPVDIDIEEPDCFAPDVAVIRDVLEFYTYQSGQVDSRKADAGELFELRYRTDGTGNNVFAKCAGHSIQFDNYYSEYDPEVLE